MDLQEAIEKANVEWEENPQKKVEENQVIASGFVDIEEHENIEIVYASEIYIQVIKRLVEESRRKIKELTTRN